MKGAWQIAKDLAHFFSAILCIAVIVLATAVGYALGVIKWGILTGLELADDDVMDNMRNRLRQTQKRIREGYWK